MGMAARGLAAGGQKHYGGQLEPVSGPGIALLLAEEDCARDLRTLRRVIAALGGHREPPPEPGGTPGAAPMPRRESARLANVKRGPVCEACGMQDPPAERTCATGGLRIDHYVGTRYGCPGCGRLPAACRREPCPAMTGVYW